MSDALQREVIEAAPLQELAAERLAAHRRRRYGFEIPSVAVATAAEEASHERLGLPAGAARVREAVAERYRHSVSYREFLAAEAERALVQAQAQMEIATRNVAAVAAAQTKLMEELELWPVAEEVASLGEQRSFPVVAQRSFPDAAQRSFPVAAQRAPLPSITAAATTTGWPSVGRRAESPAPGRAIFYAESLQTLEPPKPLSAAAMSAAALIAPPAPPGLRVRLHEPMQGTRATLTRPIAAVEDAEQELQSLDAEIAFRAAPEFDEHLLEPLTIQPNILEFPRQLVAPRRVRPRLAEGPLRDADAGSQLRIFEVEAAVVSLQPEPGAVAAPEWQSVVLGAPVRERAALPVAAAPAVKPELKHMAPLMLRFIACVIDACWVGLVLVGVVCGVAKAMGPTLPRLSIEQMGAGAAAGLLTLGLFYGMVFLSLTGATPGMMYAEIGLYRYDAADAKRSTLRLWWLLTLLSALPVGLGLLWPVADPEGLGWQDRVCGVYPRLV